MEVAKTFETQGEAEIIVSCSTVLRRMIVAFFKLRPFYSPLSISSLPRPSPCSWKIGSRRESHSRSYIPSRTLCLAFFSLVRPLGNSPFFWPTSQLLRVSSDTAKTLLYWQRRSFGLPSVLSSRPLSDLQNLTSRHFLSILSSGHFSVRGPDESNMG